MCRLCEKSQVLDEMTLSGTPECPSYLITIKKNVFLQYISSSDNKSVSHWIMFDYFFQVWKVNIYSITVCLYIITTSRSLYKYHYSDLDVVSEHMYYIKTYILYMGIYYGFGLLHTFSLVLQPWMSAYIRKTDGVYMYVFGLPHLGPKKQ